MPISDGARFSIINAMTKSGFVYEADDIIVNSEINGKYMINWFKNLFKFS